MTVKYILIVWIDGKKLPPYMYYEDEHDTVMQAIAEYKQKEGYTSYQLYEVERLSWHIA
jgi:hypothetical protein